MKLDMKMTAIPLLKRCAIIPVLWLIFSAPSQADLTLRYDAIDGSRQRPAQRILIGNGMLRVDAPGQSRMSLLLDLNQGQLIQLRHDLKRYFSVPLSTLLQYSGLYENNRSVFQGLIDQGLRQLDARQRQQAEGFLDQLKHPQRARIRLQALNRKGEVLGVVCDSVAVLQPGTAPREVCVGRYRDLGIDGADRANIDRIEALTRKLQQTGLSRWFNGVAGAWQGLQGLPLEVLSRDTQGRIAEHWKLGRLSRAPIPPSALRIPPGYSPSSTPLL